VPPSVALPPTVVPVVHPAAFPPAVIPKADAMIALRKLLIANRGEIACRIARTARRLGMATVAVYSDADRDALHVAACDEAVHIGAGPASESYLRIEAVVAAAKATGADCIHPGYGFLAENPALPDACKAAGLTFVGPSAEAMRALGGKAAAKDIAIRAGVPVVPGYQGAAQDVATLAREAGKVGYPVMIKAVAGGGGRGMRFVERAGDLAGLLESAEREAMASFGDPRVLIEKVVVAPRHVEVQVFGDRHGNVVHLFERDCTLQRRNQKVVEEAPAPGMAPALREAMCKAAVTLATAVGYEGAGTVEFLVEGGTLTADARWYFIEMNTRLQVEHPVTEAITGLDLVEWQLRVAAGERLPLGQAQIGMRGHAMEVRLCAEDPADGFAPGTGRIAAFEPADLDGLRVDTGFGAGDTITPFYDSLLAKLIVHGEDREAARTGLAAALERTFVAGPRTNAAFLHALLLDAEVAAGRMDTGLIARELPRLTAARVADIALAEGVTGLLEDEWQRAGSGPGGESGSGGPSGRATEWASPWAARDGFQLGDERRMVLPIEVDGKLQRFEATWRGKGEATPVLARLDDSGAALPLEGAGLVRSLRDEGGVRYVISNMVQARLARPVHDPDTIEEAGAGNTVRAPITGRVAKLFVAAGESIEKGQRVAVVEAMKMEHVLHAARAGTITRVAVTVGQQVGQGALVAELAAELG
jgi:3-methylcrotonyl-CoA carboxylase alpha subunit